MFKVNLKSGIARDIVKVLTGNIVAQGLAFLATILVSRDLGPARYGEFALIVAVFTCITQLSDFGTATSYVRFLSRNKATAARVLSSVILFKTMVGAVLGVAIWICAPLISTYFFGNAGFTRYFQLTATALTFHSMLTTYIAHLQGLEQFRNYSLLSIAHHGLRLVLMLAVAFGFSGEQHFAYFLYAYFFVAAALVIVLLASWRIPFVIDWSYIREVYGLGFWIFLSSVAVIVMMRIDVVMLQRLSSPEQIGFYSAASSVAMIFPLITMSITATLMPKMDLFLREHTVRQFIHQAGRLVKYVLIGCVVLELVSPLLIQVVYGDAYRESASVFGILLVSYMFGIIVNPISLIYYQVNRAYVLCIVNWLQVGIGYGCNLLLIPQYGADGAALSSLILHIFSSSVIVGYLYLVQPSLSASVGKPV